MSSKYLQNLHRLVGSRKSARNCAKSGAKNGARNSARTMKGMEQYTRTPP